jgi:hypothetical protein
MSLGDGESTAERSSDTAERSSDTAERSSETCSKAVGKYSSTMSNENNVHLQTDHSLKDATINKYETVDQA